MPHHEHKLNKTGFNLAEHDIATILIKLPIPTSIKYMYMYCYLCGENGCICIVLLYLIEEWVQLILCDLTKIYIGFHRLKLLPQSKFFEATIPYHQPDSPTDQKYNYW